jgi:hypothetical protein
MPPHAHDDDARTYSGSGERSSRRSQKSTVRTAGSNGADDAHAVGTGLGAAGGAAIGGVIGGSVVGPVGAGVGATVGAALGGLAGREVASAVDPAEEDSYWRDNYRTRPYADDTLSYDHYRPAYRYGWESRERHAGRRWDQVERELERGWREHRGVSHLGWADAKLAARDAWQRVDNRRIDERERQRVEDDAVSDRPDA